MGANDERQALESEVDSLWLQYNQLGMSVDDRAAHLWQGEARAHAQLAAHHESMKDLDATNKRLAKELAAVEAESAGLQHQFDMGTCSERAVWASERQTLEEELASLAGSSVLLGKALDMEAPTREAQEK